MSRSWGSNDILWIVINIMLRIIVQIIFTIIVRVLCFYRLSIDLRHYESRRFLQVYLRRNFSAQVIDVAMEQLLGAHKFVSCERSFFLPLLKSATTALF